MFGLMEVSPQGGAAAELQASKRLMPGSSWRSGVIQTNQGGRGPLPPHESRPLPRLVSVPNISSSASSVDALEVCRLRSTVCSKPRVNLTMTSP